MVREEPPRVPPVPVVDLKPGLSLKIAAEAEDPLEAAARTVPHRWKILVTCGTAMFLGSAYQTSVVAVLPQLQDDLGTTLVWATWTITAFALGGVVVLPITGRLADQFGRRRVLLVALVLFGASALAAYFVTNIGQLIALRLLQAVGSGALLPCCMGIAADAFPDDRDRAVGAFSSIMPAGGLVGPIIGGVAVALGSWRGIFLAPVPLIVLIIAGVVLFVPDVRTQGISRSVDVRGIALLAVSLSAGMLAIALLGQPGGIEPGRLAVIVPLFAGAAALGAAFLRHTRTAADPVIPRRFLAESTARKVNALNIAFGAAAMGMGSLLPLFAQVRYGFSALSAGTILSSRALGMVCVAGIATFALRRFGYRTPIALGYAILAATYLLLWVPAPSWVSTYLWLAVLTGVAGLGMGTCSPALNNAALRLAPDQVSSMSGLRAMFRQIGAIVAVSVTSAVVTASADQGRALAIAFGVSAVVFLATIPLAFSLPDRRGRW